MDLLLEAAFEAHEVLVERLSQPEISRPDSVKQLKLSLLGTTQKQRIFAKKRFESTLKLTRRGQQWLVAFWNWERDARP